MVLLLARADADGGNGRAICVVDGAQVVKEFDSRAFFSSCLE